ncbi:hypothetical protein GOP47_0011188 [Adiantum capillus-veneris]|uniref:Uncharacterized protein n=1 Tax=Adiantum capillus-veneris TaxID=13818 RepID=A0A9D4USP5_ADICA|nr:hypothetical protein GOP47_0011188 [Adiantum capillus-veneris]
MTLLSPKHNYAADECIAQIPQHHIPTQEEKVRASESFNKSVLVAAHMAALHDAYILEMATHPVNEVNIKPASPTSSIGGLKPSTLKQLKIGKVHRRRVVNGTLCSKTLCTKTHDGLMVVNVFEDEEGNATPIYLSNAMEGNGGSAQAQRFYPQDSKVAVKEPYLTRLPDGEVVLLVEKMTDLVFLWVPDYVEENEGSKEGNCMYEDGREAFALEKKDGMPNDDTKDADIGNVSLTEEEDVKSSSASRELKFDSLLGAMGKVDNVKIEDDGKDEENASSGALAAENVIDSGEVKADQGSRDLSMEDILSMCKSEHGNRNVNGATVRNSEDEEVEEIGKESKTGGEVERVDADIRKPEIQQEERDVGTGETAASLRVKGNALFTRGEYNKASDMYTRATEKARLDIMKKEEVLCLSNRAEVWLRLCRNQAALDDAESVLKILRELDDDTNKGDLALAKALFRKGRALMGLHKYEDAMRVLQEVLGKAPADRQLREAATKCRDRLQHVLKPGKRQRAAMNRKKSGSFMRNRSLLLVYGAIARCYRPCPQEYQRSACCKALMSIHQVLSTLPPRISTISLLQGAHIHSPVMDSPSSSSINVSQGDHEVNKVIMPTPPERNNVRAAKQLVTSWGAIELRGSFKAFTNHSWIL